jgi:UDP-N-acetylglucosamine transferase subunit ALG13
VADVVKKTVATPGPSDNFNSADSATDMQPQTFPPFRQRPLKVCLAASGGGHVRQILDLEPAWSSYDYFFLTEETALGESIARKHRARFIPHFALGQARLGAPLKMLSGAFRNFFQSAQIILEERPDVVISTGAGAVFFGIVWARLIGARIVVIESFARFDRPSAFARLAGPWADNKVVQSASLAAHIPDAAIFDPLMLLDEPAPKKDPLLFATVGATLPFDRLVKMVVDAKAKGAIPERIIIQTGSGGWQPEGFECYETLPFETIQSLLQKADIVVCHGGTGSLITALREGCRVIAVPRLFERGEHYDNHQAEISEAFVARGLIEQAETQDDFVAALGKVRARPAVLATTNPIGLIKHLNTLLLQWARERGRKPRS